MQMLRAELARAQAERDAASDQRAQDALDGVILALTWAIEDHGNAPPAAAAASYRTAEPPKPAPAKAAGKKPAAKAAGRR